MALQKKDFIEINFTGKIKGGEVFDSNLKEELIKMNPNSKNLETKPFIFSLGEGMFLKGIDDFLIGKPDKPSVYEIEIPPEKAFGKRVQNLIQKIPIGTFQKHDVNPYPGIVFNFDGRLAKILSVSGGRVIVDFNHLLAGKTVIYTIELIRKIEDLNEKIKSFNEFFFKRDFKFEIKDKKIEVEVESPFVKFVEIFKDKFKELFNLELILKEISETETSGKEAHKKTQ